MGEKREVVVQSNETVKTRSSVLVFNQEAPTSTYHVKISDLIFTCVLKHITYDYLMMQDFKYFYKCNKELHLMFYLI